MHPLEKRLKELKSLREAEENSKTKSQKYIDDLNMTIVQCENSLKKMNKMGFQMVEQ